MYENQWEETKYAGFWIRFAALFLDSILLAIPNIVFYLMGVPFVGNIVALAYFVIMPTTSFQGTFGKHMVGIKIISRDGGPIGAGRSVGRYFAQILSGMILYIGYMMAGWTQNKQALHDKICDTYVVYKD